MKAKLAFDRATPEPSGWPSTRINIRDATYSDLPKILTIERLAFASPWNLNSFKNELALPFSRLIVAATSSANSDSDPVGFLCRWLVADECHVLNIAVHPQFRRLGIAKRLMGATIAEVRAKGARLVTLEVRRSNFAARQLYRVLGFEERRLRKGYYGPGKDAIVMERWFN